MTAIDFQIKLLEIELEYCPQNWIAKEEIKRLKEYKEKHKKGIDTTSKVCYNIIVKRKAQRLKKNKKSSKKVLTKPKKSVIIKSQSKELRETDS